MYKILFWLNIPSIHQSPLLNVLRSLPYVDLRVGYFNLSYRQEREQEGWTFDALAPDEIYISSPVELNRIPDWQERVHIVPGISDPFCVQLLPCLMENHVEWIHWGERGGISFARKVHFNRFLVHVIMPWLQRFKLRHYSSWINHSALGALAIGSLAEQYLVFCGVHPEKIRHLYYSCADLVLPTQQSPRLKLTFIYLGSLYELKGIDILLKAFAALPPSNWHLLMVGKDLRNNFYQHLAEKLGIQEQVTWCGSVASDRIAEYLCQADVLVLPTLFDGWGVVLNEAACAGLALISTEACGAAWQLIEPGRNGYRIRAGSIRALRDALLVYVNNPKLAACHGQYSRELYFKEFSAECNARRLLNSIEAFRQGQR